MLLQLGAIILDEEVSSNNNDVHLNTNSSQYHVEHPPPLLQVACMNNNLNNNHCHQGEHRHDEYHPIDAPIAAFRIRYIANIRARVPIIINSSNSNIMVGSRGMVNSRIIIRLQQRMGEDINSRAIMHREVDIIQQLRTIKGSIIQSMLVGILQDIQHSNNNQQQQWHSNHSKEQCIQINNNLMQILNIQHNHIQITILHILLQTMPNNHLHNIMQVLNIHNNNNHIHRCKANSSHHQWHNRILMQGTINRHQCTTAIINNHHLHNNSNSNNRHQCTITITMYHQECHPVHHHPTTTEDHHHVQATTIPTEEDPVSKM